MGLLTQISTENTPSHENIPKTRDARHSVEQKTSKDMPETPETSDPAKHKRCSVFATKAGTTILEKQSCVQINNNNRDN